MKKDNVQIVFSYFNPTNSRVVINFVKKNLKILDWALISVDTVYLKITAENSTTMVILGTLTHWLDVPTQTGLQINGAMMKTIMLSATILMVELVVTMTVLVGIVIVLIVNAFNKKLLQLSKRKSIFIFEHILNCVQ